MSAAPTSRPSLLVIISDDQGYGDLGCMGAVDLRTPHLDRLAAGGARLTHFSVNAPVCSPSRAALLTGRHPARTGVRDVLGGHLTETGMTTGVPTLPEAVRPLGYHTGLIGKWHLGVAPGHRPADRGFDRFWGMLSGSVDYFSHINSNLWPWDPDFHPVHDLWDGDRRVFRNGRYLTELITEQAVETLRTWAAADEAPFFLVVAYNAPHGPMHAPQAVVDRFPDLPPGRRIMAAMLASMDDGVGAIVAELERSRRLEDTAIVFLSDNGPSRHPSNWLDGSMETYYGGSAGALKGGKTSLFEGGIRSPALVHWPARVPAGQVIAAPMQATDLFPTILAAAGGDPGAFDLDGQDVLTVLTDGAPSPHAELFWEFREQTAIRRGRWKLVLDGYQWEGSPMEDPVFLSDLETDPGESRNLASVHPELAAELRATALAWRARVLGGPGDGS